jgi:hypothetical protein
MLRAGFRVPVFATTLQRYDFFLNWQCFFEKKNEIFSIFSVFILSLLSSGASPPCRPGRLFLQISSAGLAIFGKKLKG